MVGSLVGRSPYPWLLAYNGALDGTTYQIGMAYSLDNITWTRSPYNPILGPSNVGFDSALVKDPHLMRFGPHDYRIWYSGYDGTHFNIGYATSPHGIWGWTKQGMVLARGGSGAWDENTLEFPIVFYEPSDVTRPYKMWYMGQPVSGSLAIGYAYSTDGIHWTKSSANPVLTVGTAGSYDDVAVIPGCIVKVGSTYNLFYQGRPNTTFPSGDALCLATFTDPEGTYTKSGNNPLLSPSTAEQALTADLSAGAAIVHIGSTTGFHANEPCILFDSGNNEADVRVLSVDSGTQLTLTANVARSWTIANSASIRSAYYNSLNGDTVLPNPAGGWIMYGTAFQQLSSSVLSERAMAATSSTLDSGWAFDYTRGLILPLETTWDTRSAENPSVVSNT